MTFPSGVGIDTAGDLSGSAWNTAGTAKIEWGTLIQTLASSKGGMVGVTTSTPLAIDGVYLSEIIDRFALSPIPSYAFAFSQSNVASATAGFLIEEGDSATLTDASTIVSATAGAGALSTLAQTALTKRYFRFKYTNAHANLQTSFLLIGGYTPSQGSFSISGAVTNAILTAVEDQTTHYLAVKEVTGALYPAGATPWAITGDGAASGAKTLTRAAGGGSVQHYITAIEVAITGAAAGNDIAILLESDNGGTPVTYWKEVIGTAAAIGSRVGITFTRPVVMPANKTADLVVAAGGSSVVITTNMQGYSI